MKHSFNRNCELMENQFLLYSSKVNNCRQFVLSILKANRLENTLFVEQAIEQLFTDNLCKISNTVIGLAGKFNIL